MNQDSKIIRENLPLFLSKPQQRSVEETLCWGFFMPDVYEKVRIEKLYSLYTVFIW